MLICKWVLTVFFSSDKCRKNTFNLFPTLVNSCQVFKSGFIVLHCGAAQCLMLFFKMQRSLSKVEDLWRNFLLKILMTQLKTAMTWEDVLKDVAFRVLMFVMLVSGIVIWSSAEEYQKWQERIIFFLFWAFSFTLSIYTGQSPSPSCCPLEHGCLTQTCLNPIGWFRKYI